MTPHPARPFQSNPAHIIISSSEQCPIDSFIDQYVETRAMRPDAKLHHEVMEALRNFSCAAPVMLYAMNAWLDSRLGLKALHPDYLEIIDEFGDFPPHMPPAFPQDQSSKLYTIAEGPTYFPGKTDKV